MTWDAWLIVAEATLGVALAGWAIRPTKWTKAVVFREHRPPGPPVTAPTGDGPAALTSVPDAAPARSAGPS